MPEFAIEFFIFVITDFQNTIFNPECVFIVVVQLIAFDFHIPAFKVFAIEEAYPFLLCVLLVDELHEDKNRSNNRKI